MQGTVHGGAVTTRTKRVFLLSGTAYEGYAVCYNFDTVGVTAENDALSVGTAITDWNDARRVQVEVPSDSNNLHFAGVVDHASDGVVGPNWILIHEPGSVCKIYASVTTDPRDTTIATKNSGEMLTFTVGQNSVGAALTTAPYVNGQFTFAGFSGEGSAILLESEATSSDLIMADLMIGPPSGGYQCIPFATTFTGVTCMVGGVSRVSSAGGVTNLGVASCGINDGQWVGMCKRILCGTAYNTEALLKISFSGCIPIVSSAAAGTNWKPGDAAYTAVTAVTLGSTAAGFLNLQWNGTTWLALSDTAIS